MIRSSCPEVFDKKGALKIFAKITGKHLCGSLFFNKFVGSRHLIVNYELLVVNFAKFSEHLWRRTSAKYNLWIMKSNSKIKKYFLDQVVICFGTGPLQQINASLI